MAPKAGTLWVLILSSRGPSLRHVQMAVIGIIGCSKTRVARSDSFQSLCFFYQQHEAINDTII